MSLLLDTHTLLWLGAEAAAAGRLHPARMLDAGVPELTPPANQA